MLSVYVLLSILEDSKRLYALFSRGPKPLPMVDFTDCLCVSPEGIYMRSFMLYCFLIAFKIELLGSSVRVAGL